MEKVVCPVCNGSGRRPAGDLRCKEVIAGYDEATDTLNCRNCGGQYMSCTPIGRVPVNPKTGEGCIHNYDEYLAGNCYRVYTCKHCGDRYSVDSSG